MLGDPLDVSRGYVGFMLQCCVWVKVTLACVQVLPKLYEQNIEVDVPELLKQVSRRGGFWCTCAIQVRTYARCLHHSPPCKSPQFLLMSHVHSKSRIPLLSCSARSVPLLHGVFSTGNSTVHQHRFIRVGYTMYMAPLRGWLVLGNFLAQKRRRLRTPQEE